MDISCFGVKKICCLVCHFRVEKTRKSKVFFGNFFWGSEYPLLTRKHLKGSVHRHLTVELELLKNHSPPSCTEGRELENAQTQNWHHFFWIFFYFLFLFRWVLSASKRNPVVFFWSEMHHALWSFERPSSPLWYKTNFIFWTCYWEISKTCGVITSQRMLQKLATSIC